jgi:hypothetical protein
VFIPVYRMSVVSIIKFLIITGKLLAEVAFWKETVFDKKFLSVSRINVDAFFLSLATNGILKLEPKKDSVFQELFIEAHIGTPLYKCDNSWNGINVFSETRKRKRDPSLLNYM